MTNVLYVTSLVITGVLVVTLAAVLLTVLALLRSTTSTLTQVVAGVRGIAQRTEPIADALADVNGHLSELRDGLQRAVPTDGRGAERPDSRTVTRR